MKRPGYNVGRFLALLFAFTLTSLASQAVRNKAIIRAIRNGSVQVSFDQCKTWTKARAGLVIGKDSVVRTDNDAIADLFLGENGLIVRLTQQTTLAIKNLGLQNAGIERIIDTQLDLQNGRILGQATKMAAASTYEIKTPVGIAGIHAGEFSLAQNGDLHVLAESVMMIYTVVGANLGPDGGSVNVREDQSSYLDDHGQAHVLAGGNIPNRPIIEDIDDSKTAHDYARLDIGLKRNADQTISFSVEHGKLGSKSFTTTPSGLTTLAPIGSNILTWKPKMIPRTKANQ